MLAVALSEIENSRARTIAIEYIEKYIQTTMDICKENEFITMCIMKLQNWVFELAIRFTCIVSNEAVVQ